ncbi:hypothetical protein KC571_03040 [candidate division WWE3 bacterium]|uniref:Uncharacterized protein n=1 Tax=candidate division WWE3 bacterium TaxID=2053526 RepID=A0A955LH94_UNCKA|nr:hypothetical protein [candidate division WWE3 bacterium]
MNTHSDISPNPKQKDFHFLNKYQTPYIEQNISNLNLANGAVEIIKCLSDVTKLKIIILLSKTKNASVSDISKLLIIEA